MFSDECFLMGNKSIINIDNMWQKVIHFLIKIKMSIEIKITNGEHMF